MVFHLTKSLFWLECGLNKNKIVMVKKTPTERAQKLREIQEILLFLGEKATETELIQGMIIQKIFLPEILTKTIQGKPIGWETMIKNICLVTGQRFEDFNLSKNVVAELRKNFPKDCLGCQNKHGQWKESFKKITKEIKAHTEKFALA